jgi:hypothetical protein
MNYDFFSFYSYRADSSKGFSLICGKNVTGHGLILSDALPFPGFRNPKDA